MADNKNTTETQQNPWEFKINKPIMAQYIAEHGIEHILADIAYKIRLGLTEFNESLEEYERTKAKKTGNHSDGKAT